MAQEAATPAGGDDRVRRWGANGYAGEWVRASDVGAGERVRWIEEDDGAGSGAAARWARPAPGAAGDGSGEGRPVA